MGRNVMDTLHPKREAVDPAQNTSQVVAVIGVSAFGNDQLMYV